MIPVSFSATAMQVSELCMARYHAEHLTKGRSTGNPAALNGSAVHTALEMFVKGCYLDKTHEPNSKLLLDLYRMSYMSTFGTADTDTIEYTDGIDMLSRWWMRSAEYLSNAVILSCEVKESFPIPTSVGEIPYNYIFDRSDDLGNNEYEVIDYKSQRWAVRAEDLKKKVQVRAYGLAMQILYPDAKRIWVTLDFLRHDGGVGVVLTRDDNIASWQTFKSIAQRIIDTPETDIEERLNPECRFCVRKASCKTMFKNIAAGGIMGVGTNKELVTVRAQLEWQKQAIESSIKELDTIIMSEAKETDTLEWESDIATMAIGASWRRSADGERVERVIGEHLFRKYGSAKITVASIEKLLKGDEITEDQKKQLRPLLIKTQGEAKVNVKAKGSFDDV